MTNTSPYRPLGDSPGYGNPIDPADIPPPFETPTGARYTPAAADRADYAPRTADDVTTELVNMTVSIVDGWYADTRIDWEDVYDRLERGAGLDDGRRIDLGEDLGSPALEALKRRVRAARRDHG